MFKRCFCNIDFPADTNCWMLLLRWCMRENLIFSPCLFFSQHKSRYSGSLIYYKEENDQENKNIRKVQCVRDEEREREQKAAEQLWKQGSQLRGMKGTGCRRLFVKNDLWILPHSPKCLFFISFSRFTVGSRARNLGEISLSRFIYSLPDRPKIA